MYRPSKTTFIIQRRHILLLLSLALLILVAARHHLHRLAEVARTYATFYSYVSHHPETLYRYSSNTSHALVNHESVVPQIIHQIFLTEGRNASINKYAAAVASCQDLHPTWKHKIWREEDASSLIAHHYPDIWPHYRNYKQSIQRANILRYALLDHFGGVYLDLDVTCLQPLDHLRHLPWLTPGAYPAGVNNAFVLSKPNHSFARHLLNAVESHDLVWGLPYVENMLSSGCMFFSNMWMSYVQMLSCKSKSGAATNGRDSVFILADENGNMDPHMLRGVVTTPLFKHGGASSWHSWDAAAIVLIGKHYYFAFLLISLGTFLGSLAV